MRLTCWTSGFPFVFLFSKISLKFALPSWCSDLKILHLHVSFPLKKERKTNRNPEITITTCWCQFTCDFRKNKNKRRSLMSNRLRSILLLRFSREKKQCYLKSNIDYQLTLCSHIRCMCSKKLVKVLIII